jgi:hypothetical protein
MIPIVVGVSIVDYLYLLLDNPWAQRHLPLMNEPNFAVCRKTGKRFFSTIFCY